MNGFPPPAVGHWREIKTPDGKSYYHNAQTNTTQWTKPEELMTPAERALKDTPWTEYTAEGGRKYWYNKESKQTTWEMPDVFKQVLQEMPPARPAAPAAPTFVAGGIQNFPSRSQPSRDDSYAPEPLGRDRQIGYGQSDTPRDMRPALGPASANTPNFSSIEEAEAAFFKMLTRSGVTADSTWTEAQRATIKDPVYMAIKDPKDRVMAFEKFVVEARAQEKDKEKERLTKLRSDFRAMLKSHPEVVYCTRWVTARPIIEGETIYRNAKDEEERKQLFSEYIVELKIAHAKQEEESRKSAIDELASVFKSLDLEPYTRWSEAQELIASNKQLKQSDNFKSLHKLDILKTFEGHIKALERTFNEEKQKEKASKFRRERKNRDAFKQLLGQLKADGHIKAGSKWMDIYPLIANDSRYDAMLDQCGPSSKSSSPIDLFWDIVEEEEQHLRPHILKTDDVLYEKRFAVTAETSFEEFVQVLSSDRRTGNLDRETMQLVFERIREKSIKRTEKDKHAEDRRIKDAQHDLRAKFKRLEPPIQLSESWEQVRPRIENFKEYQVLGSDDLRHAVFDKHMHRLKEKKDDRDRERARRDDRHRERDRERERDRDYRNGHGRPDRRHRDRSLSPEPDAYEADRKKAQADRERQYRKSSATGLSPPHRRDRSRDRYERRPDRVSSGGYDRERRDRELERERSYLSRADPRDKGSELDYGDSRAGSMVGGTSGRRRRDSDATSDRRDSKRHKRNDGRGSRDRTLSPRRHRSKTPASAIPLKEDPGLRSGSEEGEIEED